MNTQEIKGAFIHSKSQLIVLDGDKKVLYSCDKLVRIENDKSIELQLSFVKHVWNLLDQLKADKEPLVIPAVNIENAHEANKICDVQISKVNYGVGAFRYYLFLIDAFPFNAGCTSGLVPDNVDNLDLENRQAMIAAERDFIQHLQLNFNEQLADDFDWPLYQILISAEALQRQLSNSKSLTYLSLIRQAASYLQHLSRRNLDFPNYVNDPCAMLKVKTDLLEFMDSLYRLFKRDPGSYFKGLKVIISPDVPRYFSCDVTRTTQVLSNMLSTLIKHGNKGEITLKVSFNGSTTKPVYSFTINHTGIYIEKELLPNIFAGSASGVGKKSADDIHGLFLVKKLADILNAELQVRSSSSEGTFINLDLPVSKIMRAATKSESTGRSSDFPALPNLSVLLVEDSKIDRMVLSNMLDDFGFKFDTAVNGIDALRMLNAEKFDLVIMDLYMPQLDGYQTVSKIRNNIHAHVRNIPVLAISSGGGQSNLQEVVNLGATDYMLKPVNRTDLLRKLLTISGNLEVKYLNTYLRDQDEQKFEVDIQAFRDASLGDHQFMLGLMDNVIDQTEESLILIRKFLLDDNFPAVRKIIHKIKPIVRLYGIQDLNKVLEEAESMAIQQVKFNEWEKTVSRLQELFNQAIRSLNNEILNIRNGVFYTGERPFDEEQAIGSH